MPRSDPGARDFTALDRRCIDCLRFLAVDMVEKAKSGHPGLPLGAAPMAYVLWARHLKYDPADPLWFDRDRFVLSAGHGSALLYALLHLAGYDLPMEELQRFRQWGSHTPGHPERDPARGIETTTGPLGQGFGAAVGMAIAEANLAARYNEPGRTLIDHRTYVLASDGDLMEGVGAEAASLAGHLRLGKLICLYDDNRVTLSAATGLSFSEDRAARFAAYGWRTQVVEGGNDLAALDAALTAARDQTARPSFIQVRTHIGYGSPNKQDTYGVHGSPLGPDETRLTKRNLGWPEEPPFLVPDDARAHFRRGAEQGRAARAEWRESLRRFQVDRPERADELEGLMNDALPKGWDRDAPAFPASSKGETTRGASGKMLAALAPRLPALIGGSADLNPSTHTQLPDLGDFQPAAAGGPEGDRQGAVGGVWGPAGRNLHFGVREHAMGTILNGLAAHGGTLPFGGTFLTFSDYMRPAIRLAALMRLHVVYVFTHDSIGLGEDGPTHQPIEQVASLRAMPNLVVIRPADANETVVAWRVAVTRRDGPTALILTRQSVPTLDRKLFAPAAGLERGAYILADPPRGQPELILLATGSEVALAVAARDRLQAQGRRVRLVSMPSWELFAAQPDAWRDEVLPPAIRARLAVEAGATQGWWRWVGDAGDVIGLDRFGESAPGEVVMRELGFTVEAVCDRAVALLAGIRGE